MQSENCLRFLFLVCIVVSLGNYAYGSAIPGGTLDEYGNIVLDDDDDDEGEVFGPTSALLGTLADGPLKWGDSVTENPMVGDTEIWEIHNFTEDAHPIHVHLIMFQVLGRGPEGTAPPEPWEIWAGKTRSLLIRKRSRASRPDSILRVCMSGIATFLNTRTMK